MCLKALASYMFARGWCHLKSFSPLPCSLTCCCARATVSFSLCSSVQQVCVHAVLRCALLLVPFVEDAVCLEIDDVATESKRIELLQQSARCVMAAMMIWLRTSCAAVIAAHREAPASRRS